MGAHCDRPRPVGSVVSLSAYRDARARGTAVAPWTRARTDWTPSSIQHALAAADNGMLRDAADLVETLLTDDRVSGVTSTRTLGMLGLPLSFVGDESLALALSGDDATDGEWDAMHPESELAQLVSWGIILGVGLAQRVKLPRGAGEPERCALRVWHPRHLRYQYSSDIDSVTGGTWHLQTRNGDVEIAPGDGEWVLYTPYGSERPWAHGLWRTLAFVWILKQFALIDRARHLEVLGSPIRVGIAAEGATEDGRRKWQRALANLSRDSALVLPSGYKLELVEATGNSWEMYESQVKWADHAIAVTINGQVVTTEGSTGFSDGKEQGGIARSLVRFTAKTLGSCLRSQSLQHWVNANHAGKVPPRPHWDAESSAERLERARSMISLGEAVSRMDAALASSGKRIDTDALAQHYGIATIELPRGEKAPSIAMAPTDVVKFVLVNEVRASAGLGPLLLPSGAPDPDGLLPAGEYMSRFERASQAAAPKVDDAGDGSEGARATQEREAQAVEHP